MILAADGHSKGRNQGLYHVGVFLEIASAPSVHVPYSGSSNTAKRIHRENYLTGPLRC